MDTTTSIAIAHDQFCALGGAERVAIELARTFDAPIYAAAVDETIVPEDVDVRCTTTSRVGRVAMRSHYLAQDLYQMLAWQHVDELYEYDVVIQNKTNPYWFVPKDTQTVVRYCHSPPRGLYDQFYRRGRSLPSRLIKTAMRPLYLPVVAYADAWAVNSELVARRLERYWGVDSEAIDVVHPPVETARLGRTWGETGESYLTIGRIVDHKRVDAIIDAFRGRDARLVVAGDGPEVDALFADAPPNVTFLGYVDAEEKARLLSRAKAVIMAAENEDFGMVPIEAFASGTPVIGINDGFTRHQIVDGKNGVLFERGALPGALDDFERVAVRWSDRRIERFADRFSIERFGEQMIDVVEAAIDASAVTTSWDEERPSEREPPTRPWPEQASDD